MTSPSYYPGPRATVDQYAPFNVLSIITLIAGVLGFNIVAVVLGHISLSQLKRSRERGRTLAIIGLVLGYLGIIALIFVLIAVFTAIAVSSNSR